MVDRELLSVAVPLMLLLLGVLLGYIWRGARSPISPKTNFAVIHASRDKSVEVWIALYSHALEARREVSKRVAAISLAGLALTASLIAAKVANPILGYMPGIAYTLALYCTVIPLTRTSTILARNTNRVFDQLVLYRPDPAGQPQLNIALKLPDPGEWNFNRILDAVGYVLIILALMLSATQLFFTIDCPQKGGWEFRGFNMCRITT